jgi:hypothetical protein
VEVRISRLKDKNRYIWKNIIILRQMAQEL